MIIPIVDLLLLTRRTLGESNLLNTACLAVIDDPAFRRGIASASNHPASHQVRGGLALHTLEVAQATLDLGGGAHGLVAAVFHDYGKILEYDIVDGKVIKLPFAKEVGHIVYGWAFWVATATELGITEETVDSVGHAILAHHGRKEWGSPVEPQTKLAYILHTADMLSARGLVKL
jgi:3'-5' exoribonuclease